ncbi:MAG: AbrB/MazE/SpoVT family DNA-binding domain-containing protein [Cyclobacteriaceae bacterium]|nr:AbrB/MazE/SpoVT family DNA-binding domain-containing protein [Cyclobacteriaceae bacterium]
MIKLLITVGNSKAIILPSELIKKYNLEEVSIEETKEGILLRPITSTSHFDKEMKKLRQHKEYLYKDMEKQANEPEIIDYYSQKDNDLSDIDLEIIE